MQTVINKLKEIDFGKGFVLQSVDINNGKRTIQESERERLENGSSKRKIAIRKMAKGWKTYKKTSYPCELLCM